MSKLREIAHSAVLNCGAFIVAFSAMASIFILGAILLAIALLLGQHGMKEAAKFYGWLFGTGFVLYWIVRIVGYYLVK